ILRRHIRSIHVQPEPRTVQQATRYRAPGADRRAAADVVAVLQLAMDARLQRHRISTAAGAGRGDVLSGNLRRVGALEAGPANISLLRSADGDHDHRPDLLP